MSRETIIGWGRRHPLIADAAVGVVAVAFSTSASLFAPTSVDHRLSLLDAMFAVSGVVIVTFRRRWPLTIFTLLAADTLLAQFMGTAGGVISGALLLAAWTVGLRTPRIVSLTACGIVSAALVVRAFAAEGFTGLRADNLNPMILVLLAAALAIAVRDRRAYLAAVLERADRAERTRETEAARRVAEERLRIARDLHDSLAHHMAVVNVQTGVAQHLLQADPPAAAVALGHARAAAGQVLDELGTVLGVLRDQSGGESNEPAPSLTRLAGLIEPMRSAGMNIRSTVVGQPRELPSAVDQAAYRLAQEALTNVQKHAAGSRVMLTIDYRDASLAVEIVNSSTEPATRAALAEPAIAGYGMTGMRERSAAVGGLLVAGPVAGGGFRVSAVLPTPVGDQSAAW